MYPRYVIQRYTNIYENIPRYITKYQAPAGPPRRAGRGGPVAAWYFVYLGISLYIWIYLDIMLVYVWFMFGICLVMFGYVWYMFSLFLVYVWFIFGIHLVYVWFIFGFICLVYVWFTSLVLLWQARTLDNMQATPNHFWGNIREHAEPDQSISQCTAAQ